VTTKRISENNLLWPGVALKMTKYFYLLFLLQTRAQVISSSPIISLTSHFNINSIWSSWHVISLPHPYLSISIFLQHQIPSFRFTISLLLSLIIFVLYHHYMNPQHLSPLLCDNGSVYVYFKWWWTFEAFGCTCNCNISYYWIVRTVAPNLIPRTWNKDNKGD